jgi:DNA (cytosine-5)-methyltransferase 1
MKVNSFFCGAGGFDLGFIQAGFEIAGAWDFDKYAVESYRHNIGDHVLQADVSKMKGEQLPKANGWLFGFPCQDISVAGKQKGMIKGETRSGLFYEIMRLLGEVSDKPEWILAENVKAVNKFIPTIEEEYDKAGYRLVTPQLYNSKYWGVPQNRERYFLLGIRKDLDKQFVFPKEEKEKLITVNEILESDIDEKYFINRPIAPLSIDSDCPVVATTKLTEAKGTNSRQWVYGTDKRMGALLADDYKQPKQILVSNIPKLSSVLEENVDEKYYIDDLKAAKIIEQAIEGLKVKQATKKGYDIAVEGDSINISHPNSKTRRGRVGKQVAQTLLTGTEQVVVERGIEMLGLLDMKGNETVRRVYDPEGLAPTLTTSEGGHRQPKIVTVSYNRKDGIEKEIDIAGTLTSSDWRGLNQNQSKAAVVELPQFRVRKLTPREYARLQGFPDSYEQVVSNSQFYKQMGNAVTTCVAHAIAKAIGEQL